jgi:hypothetical protein
MAMIAVAALAVAVIGVSAELPGEKPRPVTFSKDVAPIFQEKCESCHRPGSIAPMPLITYDQVRPWARAIKQRVVTRQMPPWHLDKTVGIQKFANDFSLTDAEISTVARWVDGGAIQGDPKDMPPPKVWKDDGGWQLARQFGEPDLILKSEDYTMPAKAQDAWFRPLTEIPLTEPRWVRAVEIRPSTAKGRRTFHHVLANLLQDEPGVSFANGAGSAGLLMEWAVNKNYDIYRPNTGKLLLPGAHISWELHLHAVGEEIRDHAELAVYLYPKGQEPKYRTYLTPFQATDSTSSSRLDIPPNSISQTQGYTVLRAPARLENFQPHMHLRGKAMSMEAILPNGQWQVLGFVDHFNFNWMTNYIFADDAAPVLPKGTVIHITAWHDNTANNPNNPDPNQWVGWGDRTVDEMAHMWVNVTYISEEDYQKWAAEHQAKTTASVE